jgi:hypothetical protein
MRNVLLLALALRAVTSPAWADSGQSATIGDIAQTVTSDMAPLTKAITAPAYAVGAASAERSVLKFKREHRPEEGRRAH